MAAKCLTGVLFLISLSEVSCLYLANSSSLTCNQMVSRSYTLMKCVEVHCKSRISLNIFKLSNFVSDSPKVLNNKSKCFIFIVFIYVTKYKDFLYSRGRAGARVCL